MVVRANLIIIDQKIQEDEEGILLYEEPILDTMGFVWMYAIYIAG